MKIQVLGSGCPTCSKLHDLVTRAVKEMRLDATVEYLTGEKGTNRIIELGAMSSPVLIVDDRIVMTGFIPDIERIKTKIHTAITK